MLLLLHVIKKCITLTTSDLGTFTGIQKFLQFGDIIWPKYHQICMYEIFYYQTILNQRVQRPSLS